VSVPLAVIEDIIDASGTAAQIQALLPPAARRRQLTARTLLTGMLLALADRRPAHLTQARNALTGLPEADQLRLGVIAGWTTGPHQLTYRQTEHTARLITRALGKDEPDGAPSAVLQAVCDSLLEASIPAAHKNTSSALAADWTDVESWSRPPPRGTTACADPEAAWGHRNSNLPGPKGEMFFGYYLSAAVMTREENGPPVPELARRITVSSCRLDPVRALAPVLTAMPGQGIPLGDIIDDSGYAHRDADAWALPLRAAGAQLVQDLHPHDRGPQGTHQGAIIANGNLYCPATPKPLPQLGPLPPGAAPEQTAARDQQTAEYRAGRDGQAENTAPDADGAGALAPVGEDVGDDGHGDRVHHRAADPLQHAERHQPAQAGCEAAQQGPEGEGGQPDLEDPAPPEPVGGGSGQDEETGDDHGIGVHRPLQAGHRGVQITLNRGERHVHDRVVDAEDEQAHAADGQDQ